MYSTSDTLLGRLKSTNSELAWGRFVELYSPLIYHWTLRAGLAKHEAADCVQEVFALLVEKLPRFTYDPRKSFRAWLRTVTLNKCRDVLRRKARATQSAIPLASDDALELDGVELFTDQEYQQFLLRRALEVMQTEFQRTTWQACWDQVVEGDTASVVAQRLSISENAAYLAKSRVLRKLRQELEGLLD